MIIVIGFFTKYFKIINYLLIMKFFTKYNILKCTSLKKSIRVFFMKQNSQVFVLIKKIKNLDLNLILIQSFNLLLRLHSKIPNLINKII